MQEEADLQARIAALEDLAARYYTVLRVIHEDYWEQTMTPFWNKLRRNANMRSEELGVRYGHRKQTVIYNPTTQQMVDVDIGPMDSP